MAKVTDTPVSLEELMMAEPGTEFEENGEKQKRRQAKKTKTKKAAPKKAAAEKGPGEESGGQKAYC